MNSRAKLATMFIAVASLGCIGMSQQLTIRPTDNHSPDVPTNTEKRMIKDPVVGDMDAIEITIPAKWHFEGGMYLMSEGGSVLGDRCSSSPTGVFRATSPDGLRFMEELPSPAWGWAKGPDAELFGVKNCFPLQGPTSAQEMLKYIAATLGVEYLRDEPVPQERTAKVQKKVDDSNAAYANLNKSSKYPTLHQTSELAWAEVRSKNGTFTMKGRLRAQVSCTERVNPPLASMTDHKKKEPTTVDTCQALLLYEAAPESQYPALAEEWDRPGMGPRLLDSWVRAWVTRRTTSSENSFIENERRLSWEAKVQHSENVRKKMIAEFDVVLHKGLDKVLADVAEKSQRNDSLSPDWTDYLLNKDLMGIDSHLKLQNSAGPFSKWVDDTGEKMFETKDPDSDPNGVLPGTWIEHGGTHKHATEDAPGAANSASPSSTQSIESRFGWVQSGGLPREPSGKPDETTSNACGPRRSSLAARSPHRLGVSGSDRAKMSSWPCLPRWRGQI